MHKNLLNIELVINFIRTQIPEFRDILPCYDVTTCTVERDFIISNQMVNDLPRYYYKLGMLYVLSLFLKTIDLHEENMLITEDGIPLIFDWEFILSPDFKDSEYSIETTGLLNGTLKDNISATLGGFTPVDSLLKPVLIIEETEPKIIWQTKSRRNYLNKPVGDVSIVHPYLHLDDINRGYTYGHSLLMDKKDLIVNFVEASNIKVRALVRPSALYRFIMVQTLYKQAHQEGLDTFIMQRLNDLPIMGYFEPVYENLYINELKLIKSFVIPYYLTDIRSKYITTPEGIIIGTTEKTPFESWQTNIQGFEQLAKSNLRKIDNILCRHAKMIKL